MWSGPRNISTALMRSWGNRDDTFVCDEPLYAHYLRVTDLEHPGRDEVIAEHESDLEAVVAWLTGPIPEGRSVFYQKHMAHHLTPDVPRDWLDGLTHVFLIREPSAMLTSLAKVLEAPTVEETGLPQQVELFERLKAKDQRVPPVIDSRDVLEDPRGVLDALCRRLDVPFQEAMLQWPAGPRSTDGVWAKHWYGNVLRSTGFAPYTPKDEPVPDHLQGVLESCQEAYQVLATHTIRA